MPDWTLKYLDDIAWVAKEYSRDPSISSSQLQRFAEIDELARCCSRSSPTERPAGIRNVVIALCKVCTEGNIHPLCNMRDDWQLPCLLIRWRLMG